MTTYFAYGSNLDQDNMKERCPESFVIGKAVLKDYALGFNIFSTTRQCGCADIFPKEGSEVWGLLYALTDQDLKNLDQYERHPDKYKRFPIEVTDESNMIREAVSYQVVDKHSYTPSKEYLSTLIKASSLLDFPVSYQNFLKKIVTLE